MPKKTEAGNPDFRVWFGRQEIIGYIEAKSPDKNLDEIEETDQVVRYRTIFPNFILTNFFEFRLYKNGICIGTVRIADPAAVSTLSGVPPIENKDKFDNLFGRFFSFFFPKIR